MKRILKYATLIYALLVFVGYWNLQSYYDAFDLQIWPYLSLGELLTSFMPVESYLLPFFLIVVLLTIGMEKMWQFDVNDDEPVVRPANTTLTKVIAIHALPYAFMVPAIVMCLYILSNDIVDERWIIADLCLFTGSIGVTMVLYALSKMLVHVYVVSLLSVAFLLVFMHTFNSHRAATRMNGARYVDFVIATTQDTLKTSDSLNIVGQTTSSLFPYDYTDKHVVVIPTTEIVRMRLSRDIIRNR